MTSLASKVRGLFAGEGRKGDEEVDEDLDETTEALLSMIPTASVVVDADDGVIRSSSDSYRLGIVRNDEICDGRVMDAIRAVRASGGKKTLRLSTQTPDEFTALPAQVTLNAGADPGAEGDEGASGRGLMEALEEQGDDSEEDTGGSGTDASEGAGGVPSPGDGSGNTVHAGPKPVTRPNWLNVTVGKISDSFVVVLINDISDSVRFIQTRDAFITNVSRQLLKPVEALGNLAGQIRRTSDLEGVDVGLIRDHLTQVESDARDVQRYSEYLSHVLNDLLLLIRAQEPIAPSEGNRLDVAEQVARVLSQEEGPARDQGVSLAWKCREGLMVHGDGGQIRAALAKLVENAVSYSPAGSTVSLVADPSSDGRYAVIRVIDRGTGIPKSEQGRIFERFYRADNQNGRTAIGIGLGLSIVKHVALTHHGSVKVWSSPGEGSTFSLILPLAGPVSVGSHGAGASAGGPSGPDGGNPNG